MKSIVNFFKSVALVAAPLLLASCFSNMTYDESAKDSQETMTKNAINLEKQRQLQKQHEGLPTYKVATLEYFPPFIILDELRNSTGFDVDILTAIGEKEKFVPVFVPIKWADAFTSLDAGTRDILASGISILPERQFNYDFSDPYLTSSFSALCISKPGTERYSDFKALFKDPTIRFVTQRNSAGYAKLTKLLDGNVSNVLQVDTQYDEVRQVIQDNADVAVDISRVMSYYINRFPEDKLYLVNDPEAQVDDLGFVFKKGNTELVEKVNSGLKKIKEDGTYDRIYRKWFGNNRY